MRYSLHTQSNVPEAVFAFHAQTAGVPVDWIANANESGIAGSAFGIQKFVSGVAITIQAQAAEQIVRDATV